MQQQSIGLPRLLGRRTAEGRGAQQAHGGFGFANEAGTRD